MDAKLQAILAGLTTDEKAELFRTLQDEIFAEMAATTDALLAELGDGLNP